MATKSIVSIKVDPTWLSGTMEKAMTKALKNLDYQLEDVIEQEVNEVVYREMAVQLRKAAKLAIKEQLCKKN